MDLFGWVLHWVDEKDIGLEPEPPPTQKGCREADWTAAAERLLLAAEETIFSISPHRWQHLRHGHPSPPTTPTSHSATPHLLLTSSPFFVFPLFIALFPTLILFPILSSTPCWC